MATRAFFPTFFALYFFVSRLSSESTGRIEDSPREMQRDYCIPILLISNSKYRRNRNSRACLANVFFVKSTIEGKVQIAPSCTSMKPDSTADCTDHRRSAQAGLLRQSERKKKKKKEQPDKRDRNNRYTYPRIKGSPCALYIRPRYY